MTKFQLAWNRPPEIRPKFHFQNRATYENPRLDEPSCRSRTHTTKNCAAVRRSHSVQIRRVSTIHTLSITGFPSTGRNRRVQPAGTVATHLKPHPFQSLGPTIRKKEALSSLATFARCDAPKDIWSTTPHSNLLNNSTCSVKWRGRWALLDQPQENIHLFILHLFRQLLWNQQEKLMLQT